MFIFQANVGATGPNRAPLSYLAHSFFQTQYPWNINGATSDNAMSTMNAISKALFIFAFP